MRSSRTCRYWGALLLALSSTFALAATVYRWVDEKGVTQYSDTPPKGVSAEAVEISPGAGPPPPETDWRKLDEEFMERHRVREKERDDAIQMRKRQAELEAIAGGAGTPVSGETFAVPNFQRKVLARLVEADHTVAPGCTDHAVTRTEALGRDMDQQTVNERWVLDRCGAQVAYLVDFTLHAIHIPPEKSEAVPGTIWHDETVEWVRPRSLKPNDTNIRTRGAHSFAVDDESSFTVRLENPAAE